MCLSPAHVSGDSQYGKQSINEVKEKISFSLFSAYLEVFIPSAYLRWQSIWRTGNKRYQTKEIIFIKLISFKFTQDYLSYDGGHYHIETSLLICRSNQWTGFYFKGTSVMKELKTGLARLWDLFIKRMEAWDLINKTKGSSRNLVSSITEI